MQNNIYINFNLYIRDLVMYTYNPFSATVSINLISSKLNPLSHEYEKENSSQKLF